MTVQTSSTAQQNSFATSAFFSFFLWGVCSSLSITVCTLVDALLVGNLVGSAGLAVANLSTPIFLALGLLGITLGVGGNVLMGKALGSSQVDVANHQFHKLLWCGLVVGCGCLALCVPFASTICGLLGAEGDLLSLALAYLTPVFYASPLFVLYHILSLSVRTDGNPKQAALAAAVVIVTNLSLDIVFMQGLHMGIGGASLSLCIAQGLGVAVLLAHFFKKHSLLTLGLHRPGLAQIQQFISNGFGVGSALLCQGIVMLWFNSLLLRDSVNGVGYVAVFGVLYTISLLPGAFFDGTGNALATVVSIFYGEKDALSIRIVVRRAMVTVSVIGVLFTLMFLALPGQILEFFGLEPSQALAVQVFAFSFTLTGLHIAVTAFWQTIGRARLAGTFSVVRNFGLMLLVGTVLIPRYGIVGLALSYCVTEGLCFVGMVLCAVTTSSNGYLTQRFQSVHRSCELYYPIQAQSMSQIASDLEDLCQQWDMGMKQSFFINLIVEELVLNIMKFGISGSRKRHYIAIKLLDNDGEYILRIRDNVKTYNPFDSQGDDIDAGAIRLITTKSSYYDYQRKLIFNYLYIIL